MLATIGDLVEDVVVRLGGPVNLASDTVAKITRRQGGSAANVAVAVAGLGHRARMIGQVGADTTGRALVAELMTLGVDVGPIRTAGTTGTIVVLVDRDGERSMLTDRGAALLLDAPDPVWLDGVGTLHVPFYSLTERPLAATATTLIGWAHERRIPVSIDLSSTALIDAVGPAKVRDQIIGLEPAVVFANVAEADALGVAAPVGAALTVVKRGRHPVLVFDGADRTEVAVESLDAVADTTGAGDAFAAGFLTYRASEGDRAAFLGEPAAAAAAGNQAAAAHLVALRGKG